LAAACALIGAVLLVVSAFLVWGSLDLSVASVSESGMDSAAGPAVIALGVGVAALLFGWFAGLPRKFVRGCWALFGIGAIGLSIYALIQIQNAPADFFSDVTAGIEDAGLDDLLGEIGIDTGDVTDIAEEIVSVDYGVGVFVALAGGIATLVAAIAARDEQAVPAPAPPPPPGPPPPPPPPPPPA
jgi:hypothetical protein